MLRKNSSEDHSIINMINEIAAENINEEDAVLVEDKAMYDKCYLSEAGIKFGTKEFYEWKEANRDLYFPSLDAPWEVRRAWREFNERTSKDDKTFISLEEQMHFNVTKPNGFFTGVRLKSINDYKNLFNLAVSVYKEFYEKTSNIKYKDYVSYLA